MSKLTAAESMHMNLNDLRRIKDQIRWDMTLQSSMVGLTDVHITCVADSDRLHTLLKERAGYFFYLCIWEYEVVLCIMHHTRKGRVVSRVVDINTCNLMSSMRVAICKQRGEFYVPGQYDINDYIRATLQQMIDKPV